LPLEPPWLLPDDEVWELDPPPLPELLLSLGRAVLLT